MALIKRTKRHPLSVLIISCCELFRKSGWLNPWGPVYFKRQRQQHHCDNSAMTLVIVFSLKAIESLEILTATPFWSDSVVTACKQSFGQGKMFTGVCLSTGGLRMMSLPVWLPGPMFLTGSLYRQIPPPKSEKQAVRILLEYFLVINDKSVVSVITELSQRCRCRSV